jgi:hypothetical protein
MTKLNFFAVTYDTFLDKAVEHLTESELSNVVCYATQKKVKKNITPKVKTIINEWELPWNNYDFQTYQFYEYGALAHLFNNQDIIKDLTHVGIVHYDVIFNKESINEIYKKIDQENNTIFYQMLRPKEQLSLSFFEVSRLCEFMSERLGVFVNPEIPWTQGWVSECMSVTPKDIFLKFGEFLSLHYKDIINILKNNTWNIMNHCPHRVCGIVERMWGFYLMSLPNNKVPMNITHDWNSYKHEHMKMNGTGITKI